jgi:hypothetical protein
MEFPYSQSVPAVCLRIKNYISAFYLFADGFIQNSNEIDDLLKKTLESIIVQNLNGILTRMIAKSGFQKINQILINLKYFQASISWFEDIMTEKRYPFEILWLESV